MMIYAYTGPPGSGKSLDMAREILTKLKAGKYIICNTEITLPKNYEKYQHKLFYVQNADITPKFLEAFQERYHEPRKEKQTVVVIDECQLKFNRMMMKAEVTRLWMQFFSQHRKRGYDILLVTPSIRYGTTPEIRENIEIEASHFKMTNYPTKSLIGMLFTLLISLSPIDIFLRVVRWCAMPKRFSVRHLFLYRPKYAGIYDTYKIQSTESESAVTVCGKESAKREGPADSEPHDSEADDSLEDTAD